MYRVNVKIEVTDEDGNPVDHRGWADIRKKPDFKPLATEQEFFQYDDISGAHATLNALHKVIQAVGEIA